MPINYGGGSGGPTADTVTNPQVLFQALPSKAAKYGYLRDVQGDVLGKWYETRPQRDSVIKMNTGGGKTVVGLLALKSSINEGVGPAVYVRRRPLSMFAGPRRGPPAWARRHGRSSLA